MISPRHAFASASARALFPVAVGPRIATAVGRIFSTGRVLSNPPSDPANAEDDIDKEHQQEHEEAALLRSGGHHGSSL